MARPNKLRYGEQNPNYRPAFERFVEKCRFDPVTGCVLWTGGTSAGRGNTARYGVFWFEGSRWFAHRWAAVHIHDFNLGESQVGHCCPHGPNTLCVHHLKPQTQEENLAELNERLKAKASQSLRERQFWLFVSLGIERLPETEKLAREDMVPFYEPPEWLRPFMPKTEISDDCPF